MSATIPCPVCGDLLIHVLYAGFHGLLCADAACGLFDSGWWGWPVALINACTGGFSGEFHVIPDEPFGYWKVLWNWLVKG